MVCPWRLMELGGYLMTQRNVPAVMAGSPIEALVGLWNGEITQVFDAIALEC